jgi:hypothetical protein
LRRTERLPGRLRYVPSFHFRIALTCVGLALPRLAAVALPTSAFFEGNYREYEDDKKKRLGEEGARPHRPRYKALTA